MRYPFYHRPLIEYMLAIPSQLKARRWPLSKMMLRDAMRDILPEEVRLRPYKDPGGNHRIYIGVKQEWAKIERCLQKMKLAELGFLDLSAFRQAAENARSGRFGGSESILPFANVLALELWLNMGLGKGIV